MSLNFMLLYSMTIFVASIIPGPSMLLALTHGMRYGARRSIASAMGNLTVTIIQASISIAGLGAVLLASGALFQIIKWAGAAYLVYMGVTILRSSKMTIASGKDHQPPKKVSLGRMYLQAALVTAGNPKAILFFTAVFPQFIDPDRAFFSQFFVLMGIGALIAFSCFMIYSLGGHKIASLFSRARIVKYINRAIGSAFIGAGIALAAGNR